MQHCAFVVDKALSGLSRRGYCRRRCKLHDCDRLAFIAIFTSSLSPEAQSRADRGAESLWFVSRLSLRLRLLCRIYVLVTHALELDGEAFLVECV